LGALITKLYAIATNGVNLEKMDADGKA
jgi:hypothetical protein